MHIDNSRPTNHSIAQDKYAVQMLRIFTYLITVVIFAHFHFSMAEPSEPMATHNAMSAMAFTFSCENLHLMNQTVSSAELDRTKPNQTEPNYTPNQVLIIFALCFAVQLTSNVVIKLNKNRCEK